MHRKSKGGSQRPVLSNTWLWLVMIALCCMSCKNRHRQDLQSQVEALYGREVNLCTENMKVFSPLKYSPCGNPRHPLFRVVSFIDSTTCSPCAMENLFGWCEFIDSLDSYKGRIGIYFIFETSRSSIPDAMEAAENIAKEIGAPIYLDTLHIFKKTNQLPLTDETRIFVLDKDCRICLVGDVLYNKELAKLFWKKVNEIQ